MKSTWSLLSYATNSASIGSLRRELCLFKWRLLQTHEFSTGPLWKAPSPTRRDVPSIHNPCTPGGNRDHELNSEKQRSQVLLSLGLCHCCPLEDWEFSLPFVLVFPCDLQEHCLYLVWVTLGIDLSVWLGEIICHRWLFEQLLVPSVRQVARVKLSLDPTTRRLGKPPHHLGIQSYGFLGRIFTPMLFTFLNWKYQKKSTTHNPIWNFSEFG
jgi:hypothetical protein